MKIKIIMDSGKEYQEEHERATADDFVSSLYSELPMGKGYVMKNSFIKIGNDKVTINPSHISSIEILDK